MRLATSNLVILGSGISRPSRRNIVTMFVSRVEAGAFLRHVVCDDHVRAFALELGARIFGDAIGFRGKSHQNAGCLLLARPTRREYPE